MKPNWNKVKIKLGEMDDYQGNPRMSTKAQAKRIIASEKKFGQPVPFLVQPAQNGRYGLLDGHQRKAAWLTEYGADFEVDAMVADRPLTEDEHKELIITLHAGATGAWDWNTLSGWDASQVTDWIGGADTLKDWNNDANNLKELMKSQVVETEDTEPQIDRAEELREKWGVVKGDVWQLGNHKILCGGSEVPENWAKLMGDERGSMVWTDPPYGISYGDKLEAANPMGYRVRQIENDNLEPEQLEILVRAAFKNCADYTVHGASIYAASPPGTLLPSLIRAFDGSGFEFRWQLIWLKDQIVLSRADYHFKHENILYGWKPDGAHFFIDDRKQNSVFEYPRPKKSDEHPTMKPIALVQHMISNSSRAGDIVLEPYSGSGTTILACENTGRSCRAIEFAEKYVSVALERWATHTGQTPVKL